MTPIKILTVFFKKFQNLYKTTKDPKQKLSPVFLPGQLDGWRSMAGNSPWGCRVKHDGATKHIVRMAIFSQLI